MKWLPRRSVNRLSISQTNLPPSLGLIFLLKVRGSMWCLSKGRVTFRWLLPPLSFLPHPGRLCLLDTSTWQMYMYFMVWRYQKRLEHYQNMQGPFYGGRLSLDIFLPLSGSPILFQFQYPQHSWFQMNHNPLICCIHMSLDLCRDFTSSFILINLTPRMLLRTHLMGIWIGCCKHEARPIFYARTRC